MEFVYNEDYELRDSMLSPFRDKQQDEENDDYDVFWFDGLDALPLQKLIDLRFADPDECQNEALSIGKILEFLQENPSFTAHGYAVTHLRPDYRMSIEGVEGKSRDLVEIHNFIEIFSHADKFSDKVGYQYAWFD